MFQSFISPKVKTLSKKSCRKFVIENGSLHCVFVFGGCHSFASKNAFFFFFFWFMYK